ncbi:MAG: molybdopterin molybdotransferase MoeA [Chloroflexi bacterium]|nr:molybdopterin molybdotransferase MoeA [Chloroflexota bacterium]
MIAILEKTPLAPYLSVSEAQQRMLQSIRPVDETIIPLEQSHSRVISQDIRSQIDWPPFATSAMDGFAVQAEDILQAAPNSPVTLEVIADIQAGSTIYQRVLAGQAARIMTGAAVPAGADTVVPVEETNFTDRSPGARAPDSVQIFRVFNTGEYVRPRGQDLLSDQVVLSAGHRLRPQDAGLLAMLGIARVPVFRRPRVAIFSTGDELLAPDQPLSPGKIHDSNSYTLAAQLAKHDVEVFPLGVVPDNFNAIQQRLDWLQDHPVDLIVTTAGVSVGNFDYMRSVIEAQGKIEFWRVNMRPGKPVTFGSYRGIPIIGLPGNPVSAFVGCEVFVRPVISRLSGEAQATRRATRAELAEPIESDGRESYLRGILTFQRGKYLARLTGHQGSGNLFSLVQANALLIVPSGVKSLPAGAEVEAWWLEG